MSGGFINNEELSDSESLYQKPTIVEAIRNKRQQQTWAWHAWGKQNPLLIDTVLRQIPI